MLPPKIVRRNLYHFEGTKRKIFETSFILFLQVRQMVNCFAIICATGGFHIRPLRGPIPLSLGRLSFYAEDQDPSPGKGWDCQPGEG